VAKPTPVENKEVQAEDTNTKKPKYIQDELLAIFDEILFSGEYREDVTIKGKLKVTFVTRNAADQAKITNELDSRKFNLISSIQEFKALLCICYSMVVYNGKDLTGMSIEARKSFIEKLPTVVVAALSNALVEFDLKTEAAMGEMDSF
jgi:hypothetical protein